MKRVAMRDLGGGVTEVVLDRPDKHNGVDWQMMRDLRTAARKVRADRSIRAVVLRGEGPSFSSGLDFGSVTKRPDRILRGFVPTGRTNLFQGCCWDWRDVPVPVVVAIHGRCYGAGLQVALAADFRIASPDAQLSVMEAKWGLIPDMAGTVALRELVGMDQAKLLTMTGRVISAQEADRIGLVTELADDPQAAALALAQELASKSPDAVAAAKTLFQENWLASEADALSRERWLQGKLIAGRNFREALSANFAKRVARFKDRSPWAG